MFSSKKARKKNKLKIWLKTLILAVLTILVLAAGIQIYESKTGYIENYYTTSYSGIVVKSQDDIYELRQDDGNVITVKVDPECLKGEIAEVNDILSVTCVEYPWEKAELLLSATASVVKAKNVDEVVLGIVEKVEGKLVTIKTEENGRSITADISNVITPPDNIEIGDELYLEVKYIDTVQEQPFEAVLAIQKAGEVTFWEDEQENPNALKDGDLTSNGYTVRVIDGVTYIDGILIANKTYRLPSSYNPGKLTAICSEAFEKMKAGAEEDGISLRIVSGFRSFDSQNRIYHGYVSEDGVEEADTYSARPGHSEHQTGLTMDLNSLKGVFAYTEEGKWLAEHCHEYGFIIRYPKGKTDITGYIYEPWHVRYVGVEFATELYNSGLCVEEFFGIDSAYYG